MLFYKKVFSRITVLYSLPLTTIMVNLKNPYKSLINPVLSPSLQNSPQCISKFPNISKLFSKASSRDGKQVHSKEKPQTCHITRCFLRSVSAFSTSRNISTKTIALSSSEESEKKNMDLDPKILTVL